MAASLPSSASSNTSVATDPHYQRLVSAINTVRCDGSYLSPGESIEVQRREMLFMIHKWMKCTDDYSDIKTKGHSLEEICAHVFWAMLGDQTPIEKTANRSTASTKTMEGIYRDLDTHARNQKYYDRFNTAAYHGMVGFCMELPKELEVAEIRLGAPLLRFIRRSRTFLQALVDLDEQELTQFLEIVAENASSLMVFARVRLPPFSQSHTSDEKFRDLQVQDDPHAYVVSGERFKTRSPNQRAIKDNIFNPVDFIDSEESDDSIAHPGLRPKGTICYMCKTRRFCECSPPEPKDGKFLLELYDYGQMGVGVRALQVIEENHIIGECVGRLCPLQGQDTTEWQYPLRVRKESAVGKTKALAISAIIDTTVDGNWTRFINHSCNDANVTLLNTYAGKYARLLVVANRDIQVYEQITRDYTAGMKKRRKYTSFAGECYCSADTHYPPPPLTSLATGTIPQPNSSQQSSAHVNNDDSQAKLSVNAKGKQRIKISNSQVEISLNTNAVHPSREDQPQTTQQTVEAADNTEEEIRPTQQNMDQVLPAPSVEDNPDKATSVKQLATQAQVNDVADNEQTSSKNKQVASIENSATSTKPEEQVAGTRNTATTQTVVSTTQPAGTVNPRIPFNGAQAVPTNQQAIQTGTQAASTRLRPIFSQERATGPYWDAAWISNPPAGDLISAGHSGGERAIGERPSGERPGRSQRLSVHSDTSESLPDRSKKQVVRTKTKSTETKIKPKFADKKAVPTIQQLAATSQHGTRAGIQAFPPLQSDFILDHQPDLTYMQIIQGNQINSGVLPRADFTGGRVTGFGDYPGNNYEGYTGNGCSSTPLRPQHNRTGGYQNVFRTQKWGTNERGVLPTRTFFPQSGVAPDYHGAYAGMPAATGYQQTFHPYQQAGSTAQQGIVGGMQGIPTYQPTARAPTPVVNLSWLQENQQTITDNTMNQTSTTTTKTRKRGTAQNDGSGTQTIASTSTRKTKKRNTAQSEGSDAQAPASKKVKHKALTAAEKAAEKEVKRAAERAQKQAAEATKLLRQEAARRRVESRTAEDNYYEHRWIGQDDIENPRRQHEERIDRARNAGEVGGDQGPVAEAEYDGQQYEDEQYEHQHEDERRQQLQNTATAQQPPARRPRSEYLDLIDECDRMA